MKIELNNPRQDEIQDAYCRLLVKAKENGQYDPKFILKFSEPVKIIINKYSKWKYFQKVKVRLFFSTKSKFCYTFNKRRGFPVYYHIDCSKLVSIEVESKKDENTERAKELKKLANIIYPGTWKNLKKQLLEDPDSMYNGTVRVSMKRKFSSSICEAIVNAFKNKTDYNSGRFDGIKRDVSVSTKMCDDGIFRAWYSSEYPGCGNGSYYLLLNPYTASLKEDD